MTDKGLFVIGIKEGPPVNLSHVKECGWKGSREECYARLTCGGAEPRQSKGNVESYLTLNLRNGYFLIYQQRGDVISF